MSILMKMLKMVWLLVGMFACANGAVKAQVMWQFSVTDGSDTISGLFTSDGNLADTEGTGTVNFTGPRWDSFMINGVDQSGAFTAGDPTEFDVQIDTAEFKTFTWSRDSRSVVSLLDDGLVGTEPGFNNNSQITLTLPGSGFPSTLADHRDQTPLVSFVPTTTMITPVPEPAVQIATVFLLLAFVGWRSNQALPGRGKPRDTFGRSWPVRDDR